MKVKTPLIIDSNERGPLCDSVTRAAEREGFAVKVEHLQGMGDYKAGNAHIECKSLSDLFQSSHSGKQGRKVSYSKVMNELLGTFARITADFDCHIYRAKDHTEAAMFIAKLHSKMHKPASRHGARAVTRVSTNDVRADMLVAVPGFGPELVQKLLERCGSIEEMLYPESLKQVKGLGATLRQRLLDVLTSEEPITVKKTYKKRGINYDGAQGR
jgi:ERCC4-type nuclease